MPLSSSPFGSEPFTHFDLGVDALVSPHEIAEMDEPWIPGQRSRAVRSEQQPMAPLDGRLAPWAAELQLPGL